MSFVRALAGGAVATQGVNPDPQDTWLDDTVYRRLMFDQLGTSAGKTVSVESALRIGACFACVRVKVNAIRTTPLEVFSFTKGGGQQAAFFTPQWRLLNLKPNPEMDARLMWSIVTTHLEGWGNAYIGKKFDRTGTVISLEPIEPSRVEVERVGGVKTFWVRSLSTGKWKPYTSESVIHVMGLSLDGLVGVSPIGIAAEAFGAGLAVEEFANRFFSNGAIPRGVLQTDKELSPGAARRLEAKWNARYRGTKNAHRVAVLEEGLKFEGISFPLQDLQFIEQRQFTAVEIARIFGVPASKIGAESGKSLTYRTVENDQIAFMQDAVTPTAVMIESALMADTDLFPPRPDGSQTLFPAFKLSAQLRADSKTRAEFFQTATGGRAWMRPSEVRSLEGLPPDDSIDDLPPSTTPGGSTGPDNGNGGADAGGSGPDA